MKPMKMMGLLLLGLLALAAPAQTNQICCRYPARVFGPQAVVNLTPLFTWWDRQAGDTNRTDPGRPLTAWYRVTGTKVATMGASWVLNAEVYTSPASYTNERVILNHPPAVEEASYYQLQAQLAEAEQLIAEAQRGYQAETNAASKAAQRAALDRHYNNWFALQKANANSQIAAQDKNAAGTELGQLDQLKAARDQIKAQLKLIPVKDGTYHVDWFAVETGRGPLGMPIYDLGLIGQP